MKTLRMSKALLTAVCLFAGAAALAADDDALKSAVSNPMRNPKAVARDSARHPLEELTFFGVKPNMTVVELWPGGGYWTDILGPYLASGHGIYYIAQETPGNAEGDADTKKLNDHIAAEKAHFGTVKETTLGAGHFEIAPAGSADLVLTFRNLHNWMEAGYADQALAACFTALKPGGVLGIEEHRGRNTVSQDPKAKDGYVRQDYTIELAKKAGFVLDASSEINANPKDTKDYPQGVWSLPPTLAEGDKNRAKYLAIGESDNYVLKFRKPR